MSIERRLFAMEARNDLFSQFDFDVTGVGALLDITLELLDLFHGAEAEQLEVAPHQRIRHGYQLVVHDTRSFLDTYIVAQRLGHLLHAIQAFKQRHGDDALRGLTIGALQLASHQQVELLIGAAQFDIRLQRYRVITLNQRVEKLVNGDRLIGRIALAEVIALQHPRHGVLRGQPNEISWSHFVHPGGVEGDLGFRRIENLEHLSFIGLRVLQYLLAGQRWARGALTAGVADHPREVADQENHLMPQLLELSQLINKHGVPEVQIRRSRIKTCIDTQWLTTLELLNQLSLNQNLFCATLDQRQLLFNRLHDRTHDHSKQKGTNHTRSQTNHKFCRPPHLR